MTSDDVRVLSAVPCHNWSTPNTLVVVVESQSFSFFLKPTFMKQQFFSSTEDRSPHECLAARPFYSAINGPVLVIILEY